MVCLWRSSSRAPTCGPHAKEGDHGWLRFTVDGKVLAHGFFCCFATHLLEQKVDIRVIQVLLGHKRLDTTALYAQVATDLLREVRSPSTAEAGWCRWSMTRVAT